MRFINTLNPRGDQHLISPFCNKANSFFKIMRITKMITNLWSSDCKINSRYQYHKDCKDERLENMDTVYKVLRVISWPICNQNITCLYIKSSLQYLKVYKRLTRKQSRLFFVWHVSLKMGISSYFASLHQLWLLPLHFLSSLSSESQKWIHQICLLWNIIQVSHVKLRRTDFYLTSIWTITLKSIIFLNLAKRIITTVI